MTFKIVSLTYGPWMPIKTLVPGSMKDLVTVRHASSVLGKQGPASSVLGKQGPWLLKVRKDSDINELVEILSLLSNPPRHMVKIPKKPFEQFGVTKDSVWFAMKQYDSHLTKAHSHLWRTIAKACIQFLSDLHNNHDKVYMDFRLENVLIKEDPILPVEIVIADYELITKIEEKKTCDVDLENRWYFMARGAEPNERLYSWRQDLEGLGYMLVALTAGEQPYYMDFMNRRRGNRSTHESTASLVKARNLAVRAAANPTLQAYFDKIAEVKWDQWVSPSVSFYEEVEALFTS